MGGAGGERSREGASDARRGSGAVCLARYYFPAARVSVRGSFAGCASPDDYPDLFRAGAGPERWPRRMNEACGIT